MACSDRRHRLRWPWLNPTTPARQALRAHPSSPGAADPDTFEALKQVDESGNEVLDDDGNNLAVPLVGTNILESAAPPAGLYFSRPRFLYYADCIDDGDCGNNSQPHEY